MTKENKALKTEETTKVNQGKKTSPDVIANMNNANAALEGLFDTDIPLLDEEGLEGEQQVALESYHQKLFDSLGLGAIDQELRNKATAGQVVKTDSSVSEKQKKQFLLEAEKLKKQERSYNRYEEGFDQTAKLLLTEGVIRDITYSGVKGIDQSVAIPGAMLGNFPNTTKEKEIKLNIVEVDKHFKELAKKITHRDYKRFVAQAGVKELDRAHKASVKHAVCGALVEATVGLPHRLALSALQLGIYEAAVMATATDVLAPLEKTAIRTGVRPGKFFTNEMMKYLVVEPTKKMLGKSENSKTPVSEPADSKKTYAAVIDYSLEGIQQALLSLPDDQRERLSHELENSAETIDPLTEAILNSYKEVVLKQENLANADLSEEDQSFVENALTLKQELSKKENKALSEAEMSKLKQEIAEKLHLSLQAQLAETEEHKSPLSASYEIDQDQRVTALKTAIIASVLAETVIYVLGANALFAIGGPALAVLTPVISLVTRPAAAAIKQAVSNWYDTKQIGEYGLALYLREEARVSKKEINKKEQLETVSKAIQDHFVSEQEANRIGRFAGFQQKLGEYKVDISNTERKIKDKSILLNILNSVKDDAKKALEYDAAKEMMGVQDEIDSLNASILGLQDKSKFIKYRYVEKAQGLYQEAITEIALQQNSYSEEAISGVWKSFVAKNADDFLLLQASPDRESQELFQAVLAGLNVNKANGEDADFVEKWLIPQYITTLDVYKKEVDQINQSIDAQQAQVLSAPVMVPSGSISTVRNYSQAQRIVVDHHEYLKKSFEFLQARNAAEKLLLEGSQLLGSGTIDQSRLSDFITRIAKLKRDELGKSWLSNAVDTIKEVGKEGLSAFARGSRVAKGLNNEQGSVARLKNSKEKLKEELITLFKQEQELSVKQEIYAKDLKNLMAEKFSDITVGGELYRSIESRSYEVHSDMKRRLTWGAIKNYLTGNGKKLTNRAVVQTALVGASGLARVGVKSVSSSLKTPAKTSPKTQIADFLKNVEKTPRKFEEAQAAAPAEKKRGKRSVDEDQKPSAVPKNDTLTKEVVRDIVNVSTPSSSDKAKSLSLHRKLLDKLYAMSDSEKESLGSPGKINPALKLSTGETIDEITAQGKELIEVLKSIYNDELIELSSNIKGSSKEGEQVLKEIRVNDTSQDNDAILANLAAGVKGCKAQDQAGLLSSIIKKFLELPADQKSADTREVLFQSIEQMSNEQDRLKVYNALVLEIDARIKKKEDMIEEIILLASQIPFLPKDERDKAYTNGDNGKTPKMWELLNASSSNNKKTFIALAPYLDAIPKGHQPELFYLALNCLKVVMDKDEDMSRELATLLSQFSLISKEQQLENWTNPNLIGRKLPGILDLLKQMQDKNKAHYDKAILEMMPYLSHIPKEQDRTALFKEALAVIKSRIKNEKDVSQEIALLASQIQDLPKDEQSKAWYSVQDGRLNGVLNLISLVKNPMEQDQIFINLIPYLSSIPTDKDRHQLFQEIIDTVESRSSDEDMSDEIMALAAQFNSLGESEGKNQMKQKLLEQVNRLPSGDVKELASNFLEMKFDIPVKASTQKLGDYLDTAGIKKLNVFTNNIQFLPVNLQSDAIKNVHKRILGGEFGQDKTIQQAMLFVLSTAIENLAPQQRIAAFDGLITSPLLLKEHPSSNQEADNKNLILQTLYSQIEYLPKENQTKALGLAFKALPYSYYDEELVKLFKDPEFKKFNRNVLVNKLDNKTKVVHDLETAVQYDGVKILLREERYNRDKYKNYLKAIDLFENYKNHFSEFEAIQNGSNTRVSKEDWFKTVENNELLSTFPSLIDLRMAMYKSGGKLYDSYANAVKTGLEQFQIDPRTAIYTPGMTLDQYLDNPINQKKVHGFQALLSRINDLNPDQQLQLTRELIDKVVVGHELFKGVPNDYAGKPVDYNDPGEAFFSVRAPYRAYMLCQVIQNFYYVDESVRQKVFDSLFGSIYKTETVLSLQNGNKGSIDVGYIDTGSRQMLFQFTQELFKKYGYPVEQNRAESFLSERIKSADQQLTLQTITKWISIFAAAGESFLDAKVSGIRIGGFRTRPVKMGLNYAGKNIGMGINASFKGVNIFSGRYNARGYVGAKGVQIIYKNKTLSYKLYPVKNQSQAPNISQTPNNLKKPNIKTNTNLLPYQNYETADKKRVFTHLPKSDVVFTQATVKALELDKNRDIDFLTYTPDGSKKAYTLVVLADGITKALVDKPEYPSNGQMIRLYNPEKPEQLMGIGYWSTEHQKIYRGGLKGGGGQVSTTRLNDAVDSDLVNAMILKLKKEPTYENFVVFQKDLRQSQPSNATLDAFRKLAKQAINESFEKELDNLLKEKILTVKQINDFEQKVFDASQYLWDSPIGVLERSDRTELMTKLSNKVGEIVAKNKNQSFTKEPGYALIISHLVYNNTEMTSDQKKMFMNTHFPRSFGVGENPSFYEGDLVYGLSEKRAVLVSEQFKQIATDNNALNVKDRYVAYIDQYQPYGVANNAFPTDDPSFDQFNDTPEFKQAKEEYDRAKKAYEEIDSDHKENKKRLRDYYVATNQLVRTKCKNGLDWANKEGKKIFVVLDGVNFAEVANKNFVLRDANGNVRFNKSDSKVNDRYKIRAISGSELRAMYRNQEDWKDTLVFVKNGKIVEAPWKTDPDTWSRYNPRSNPVS